MDLKKKEFVLWFDIEALFFFNLVGGAFYIMLIPMLILGILGINILGGEEDGLLMMLFISSNILFVLFVNIYNYIYPPIETPTQSENINHVSRISQKLSAYGTTRSKSKRENQRNSIGETKRSPSVHNNINTKPIEKNTVQFVNNTMEPFNYESIKKKLVNKSNPLDEKSTEEVTNRELIDIKHIKSRNIENELEKINRINALDSIYKKLKEDGKSIKTISDENLLELINNQSEYPPITETTHKGYKRDILISEFVKRRANGTCELCKEPAPFKNRQGVPFLENHHIEWLSKGGSDTVDNCVALCPNCHKALHIVNSPKDKQFLKFKVKERI